MANFKQIICRLKHNSIVFQIRIYFEGKEIAVNSFLLLKDFVKIEIGEICLPAGQAGLFADLQIHLPYSLIFRIRYNGNIVKQNKSFRFGLIKKALRKFE